MQLFLPPVKFLPVIFLLFLSFIAAAQDTVPPPPAQNTQAAERRVRRTAPAVRRPRAADTTRIITDSLLRDSVRVDSLAYDTLPSSIPFIFVVRPSLKLNLNSDSARYSNRYFFQYTKPVRYTVTERHWQGKEEIFYIVIAILILFALLKNSFRRYFSELFQAFFRTSVKHRQIKEQLVQNPLPSLLFNIFFVLSTAVFLALILQHFRLTATVHFLVLTLYAAIALTVIYVGKYLVLKIVGWIFQVKEASETYIFIVFTANKVLGIALLPLVVLLAFTYGYLYQGAVALSIFVVASIFLYRYFLAYVSLSRQLKINLFHFLLYLAAFEVLPLLLINKLLVMFFNELH